MNAYIIKALFNWPKPKYLTDNCRLVILRQDIVRIGTGMEIHNPLNSLEILNQNKKAGRYAGFKNSIFFKWILIFL